MVCGVNEEGEREDGIDRGDGVDNDREGVSDDDVHSLHCAGLLGLGRVQLIASCR